MRSVRAVVVSLLVFASPGLLGSGATDAAPSERSPFTAHIPAPDLASDDTGGIAARVHVGGEPVAGSVFMLMAKAGSRATVKVYDDTPYHHPMGLRGNTATSITAARMLATELAGTPLDFEPFTSPPAGGASGGLPFLLAYLNLATDGAFTGPFTVAATGLLRDRGLVQPIAAIDEKLAAAHLADADVIFTPSRPQPETLGRYAARIGGAFHWPRASPEMPLGKRVEHFDRLGRTRPAGMDVIGVRHITDVAAYLCGAGSAAACDVIDASVELAGPRYWPTSAAAARSELGPNRSVR